MDDGLHEPVELVCSDKFQTMENKSDQLLKTFWRDMGMNNKSFDPHRIAEGYAKDLGYTKV